MAEYNPDDLIGRTFLLPKNEQGERLRATIKRKVIETSKLLDNQHDNAIDKINFHLDVGQGRAEAIMSYVQILDHLDQQEQQDDLYKFRAITGHKGPLSPQDVNYKGSKYNVMVEWETGEITDEPLSLIAGSLFFIGVILPRTRVIFSVNTGNSPRYFTSSETSLTSKER